MKCAREINKTQTRTICPWQKLAACFIAYKLFTLIETLKDVPSSIVTVQSLAVSAGILYLLQQQ